MKSSLQWMKEYVNIDYITDPQQFADTLTIAGIPVEQVEYWGQDISKVYSGKINTIEKHPDADKLLICQVDMGKETLQIVTGAHNIQEGDIVPVAVHGAHLPGGVKIKKSKLRGILSQGMFCSAKEFGFDDTVLLPEEREGIWILPADTPVGEDLVTYLGITDSVYEYELTPNRADCFSMVGLSREFAVLGKAQATYPNITLTESADPVDSYLTVSVQDADLCSRYTARVLTHVKIGASPLWLQMRLRKSGVRPINNIVDVTNYVMLELGIPLHAYDYDKIKDHHLVVRRAAEGEEIQTLDETKRILHKDMLVIGDTEKAACVAGIMGGLATEVTAETKTVILECASFKGSNIRHTGRTLGLRSEASARFERGLDAEGCIASLNRCVQLLQQIAVCETAAGIVDVYPHKQEVRHITCSATQINEFLGTDIAEEQMISILQTLHFIVQKEGNVLNVTVPSYRGDCTEMPDIAEEVARIYGYENIPSTRPWSHITEGTETRSHQLREKVSDVLSRYGLSETVTFSFMNTSSLEKLLFQKDDKVYQAVPILNPITEEYPYMRTTLLPSLMDVLARNQAVKNPTVAIYEIGAVYIPKALPLVEQPEEHQQVMGLLYGKRIGQVWNDVAQEYDFYDVKGIVEYVLHTFGIQATLRRSTFAPLHPGKAAEYVIDDHVLCRFGELHPQGVDQYDVDGPVYMFEFDIDTLLPYVQFLPNYQKIDKFPAMSRDLAFLVPEMVSHQQIMDIIQKEGGSYLESVTLFDSYQGEQVPKGYKSLAYALVFRSSEGTLTETDIQGDLDRIIQTLKEQFACELR